MVYLIYMPKKIVITGGPGSGKTSLVSYLLNIGHQCMPEISRAVTIEAQKQGIEQLFLEDPILFSRKLLEGRLVQFNDTQNLKKHFYFLIEDCLTSLLIWTLQKLIIQIILKILARKTGTILFFYYLHGKIYINKIVSVTNLMKKH